MFKRISLAAFVMTLAIFAVACGGNSANGGSSGGGGGSESAPDMKTPEGTLKIYQQACKDFDGAKAASCGKKADLDKNKGSMERRFAKLKEKKQTVTFEFKDVKIDGDKATYTSTHIIKGEDGKEVDKEEEKDVPMIKEDGEWHIADM